MWLIVVLLLQLLGFLAISNSLVVMPLKNMLGMDVFIDHPEQNATLNKILNAFDESQIFSEYSDKRSYVYFKRPIRNDLEQKLKLAQIRYDINYDGQAVYDSWLDKQQKHFRDKYLKDTIGMDILTETQEKREHLGNILDKNKAVVSYKDPAHTYVFFNYEKEADLEKELQKKDYYYNINYGQKRKF